jgi:hypothetical protein
VSLKPMAWRAPSAAVAALVVAALASGCGEEQFDAAGLVDRLNAAGAQLQLGEPLSSTEGTTVTAINFAEAGGEPVAGDEHTEGAVVVLDDAEAASAEFTRCESAVDFVCFRAANAVLRFSGITPDEQARLTEAVSSLETG